MENELLLTLFKNGDYKRVINETNDTKDIDSLFLRAISQALLNQYEQAIKTLTDNENILANNMAKLIDVHMEICFWANKFLDATKALQHYEEYPYISQEVEEKFLFYKKDIAKRMQSSKKTYNEDEILKLLDSDKKDEIQLAFSEIKKYEIYPFLPSIKKVLISSKIDQSTRCLGLILLYEKKVGENVDYLWHDELINVIPNQLKTPFQDVKFSNLLKRMQEYKDVAFSQTFETILATYYLYMYPNKVEDDEDDLYVALEIITRKYLGLGQNKMRQNPRVEALINAIEEANSHF